MQNIIAWHYVAIQHTRIFQYGIDIRWHLVPGISKNMEKKYYKFQFFTFSHVGTLLSSLAFIV